MKKLLSALLFSLCLLAAGQGHAQADKWKEFVSNEGRFKINFPGVPKESAEDIALSNPKRQNRWFEVSFPETYFAVCYADYPDLPEATPEVLKETYDHAQRGMLKEPGLTLQMTKDIYLDGKLGREITVSNGSEIATARIYLINKRLFQVITSIKASLKNDIKTKADVDKFSGSFRFTEK